MLPEVLYEVLYPIPCATKSDLAAILYCVRKRYCQLQEERLRKKGVDPNVNWRCVGCPLCKPFSTCVALKNLTDAEGIGVKKQ